MFGEAECDSSTIVSDGTTITCDLLYYPEAGSHKVDLRGALGRVNSTEVTAIDIGLEITSVTPDTDLNQVGGDVLTISGKHFSRTISDAMNVTFSDGTYCLILTSTDVELTCLVDGFEKTTIDTDTPYTVTVNVNGIEDSTLTVNLYSLRNLALSVSPSSVSPILKTWITITLGDAYPDALVKEDFTAELISADPASDFVPRYIYIHEANDADKTLTLKFPGSPSADYLIMLSSANHGRIDSDVLQITTESKVTAVSTVEGSDLGGTLITIDGINFSDDPYDNPVQVDGYDCIVITTSPT